MERRLLDGNGDPMDVRLNSIAGSGKKKRSIRTCKFLGDRAKVNSPDDIRFEDS